MATIPQHIAKLRLHLGGIYDDDTHYTDEVLYRFLNDALAIVAKRNSSQRDKLSDWNVRGFSVQLEYTNVFLGRLKCKVKKSIIQIPPALTGKTRMNFWVKKSTGESIGEFGNSYEIDLLDPVKANSEGYKIINEYLIIFNAKPELKYINVFGQWADLAAWSELTDPVTGLPYFDKYTDDYAYPLDHQYTLMAYDLVKEALFGKLVPVPNMNANH